MCDYCDEMTTPSTVPANNSTSSPVPLIVSVDGYRWFTDTSDASRQIAAINAEITKQYAIATSTGASYITVRLAESVPLLAVKDYFRKQKISLVPVLSCERPECKCDSDKHGTHCKQVGYLLYRVYINV